MEKCKEALKILIKGETEAVQTYEAFSAVARKEGLPGIATLFDALSKAERIHIKNHLNALGEDFKPELSEMTIGTTLENLATAIGNESEESRVMYPRLIRSIRGETNTVFGKVARLSMNWARKAEKIHAVHLRKALKSLKKGKDFQFEVIYLCQVCGNIEIDRIKNGGCEVCGHDDQFFTAMKGGM